MQVLQIYIYIYLSFLGGGWCCWLRVIFEWHRLLGKLLVLFQDRKFLAFSTMDLTLKVWMLKYLDLLPRKLYNIVMDNQILQMVWFFLVILVFVFFFI